MRAVLVVAGHHNLCFPRGWLPPSLSPRFDQELDTLGTNALDITPHPARGPSVGRLVTPLASHSLVYVPRTWVREDGLS